MKGNNNCGEKDSVLKLKEKTLSATFERGSCNEISEVGEIKQTNNHRK